MFKKPRRKNKNTTPKVSSNKITIGLNEDSTNMAYWIYTHDNEFYDRQENTSFLYKAMLWSFLLTAAQLKLTIIILNDWTDDTIKLTKVSQKIKGDNHYEFLKSYYNTT